MNSLSIKHLVDESGLKKTYIVQALGITFPTYYRKLKHPESFTAREMKILKDLLASDMDATKFLNFFYPRT